MATLCISVRTDSNLQFRKKKESSRARVNPISHTLSLFYFAHTQAATAIALSFHGRGLLQRLTRMADYQERLQAVAGELSKIEAELEKAVEIRQRLDSQRSENEQVQVEFRRLKPDAGDAIYKLVGPVLLKQETAEAKGNVDKRIEFIDAEM